jgi:hypothetical protein
MPSNSKNIAELLNTDTTVQIADVADGAITTAKLADGAITNAKVNSGAGIVTSKLSGLDAEFVGVRQDLAIVAFDSIQSDNRSSLGLANTFVDQYEDSTGITGLTNVERTSSEYVASYDYSEKNFNEVQPQMLNGKANSTLTTWDSGNSYSTNWANDSVAHGSGNYDYGIVNYLFDLSTDFTINVYGAVNASGAVSAIDYPAFTGIITTDTSVAAGKNPGVFAIEGNSSTYGTVTPTNFGLLNLTSSYKNAINLTDAAYGNNNTNGNIGSSTQNPNDANFHVSNYLNTTSTVRGMRVVNNASTDTMNINYLSSSNQALVRTDVSNYTLTNIPHAGRFIFAFGHAGSGITGTNMFSLSTANSADAARSTVFDGIQNATGNYQSTAQTASSAVTKMSVVVMYEDNAGTNALNTDIVIQVSADNGSNYTNATLTAAPNLTSTTKVAKSGEVTVTSGTQCRYKVIFANQSASKIARIKGVALLY